MHMSNNVVFTTLALSLASTPLIADTEFGDDIPLEVVERLVGTMYGSVPKFYSDIFSRFPPFTLPAGFDVVGSADMGVQQRVMLRTTLADDEAVAAAVAAFTAQGWVELPIYGANAVRTGFIGANGPLPQPVSLCSDALGRLSVTLDNSGGSKYVNLAVMTPTALGGMRLGCAEEAEMAQRGPGAGMMRAGIERIREYMPALVMPPSDVATGSPMDFMGSGGGSSNDYETRSFLAITWDAERLLTHFAEQVVEQGWEPDVQVSGEQTAFGSWTKPADGKTLHGMLTLVETSGDNWELKFRIVQGGAAAAR
jgi:hypothetical protein